MNLFGLQIGNSPKVDFPIVPDTNIRLALSDGAPVIRPELKGMVVPENKKPTNIPPIRPNVLQYHSDRRKRGTFIEAEYDLYQIGRVEDTDSYVHQAFLKKVGLLFKEGYELVGGNPKTIQYVKLRLEQVARATGVPTEELIKSIGSGLIKKSNAFLVKVRKESASGGRKRRVPGTNTELEQIAGYFIAPPETMEVDADEFGKIRRWKQRMPDGRYKFFNAQDVVHFYFNRKDGLIFGTPTLIPVVDDIRALRKIEENIEMLVYQHLFPLFHYKIGTDDMPAGMNEYGESEIEVARKQIQYMPSEGGIVTSHRHDVKLIGTENRALRAEQYLEHFKKRVFSGLGISAVDMGEGECYDESTQTLTENGWKFHWAIDHTKERIATFNPITRKIEFHIANYKYEAPYLGPMVKFKNKYVDLMVTPSHEMWVFDNHDANWKKMYALDVAKGKAGWKAMFLETVAFWDEALFCQLPHEDERSLAYLAGYISSLGTLKEESIVISNRNGSIKLANVCEILSSLEIPWTAQEGTGKWKYLKISADEMQGFFKQFLTNDFYAFAEKFSLPARKLFVHSYVAGTFSHAAEKIHNTYYTKNFTNKIEVDKVQRLIMSAGYKSLFVEKHSKELGHHFYCRATLSEKNRHCRTIYPKRDVSIVQHQGVIYCYNVPNHLFVTRRGMSVTIQGNTANRATSDNMSRNLIDSVKDVQRTIECQFTEFVVNELLLESNFGPDVLDQENAVHLKFKEIDLDHQIKQENHYADLFNKNSITIHEARVGMGRQPFLIPTQEEIETEENIELKYPEWFATNWKLFKEPEALIKATDEPYSPAAKAAVASRATSMTEKDRQETGEEQVNAQERVEKARAKNRVVAKDSFLTSRFKDLESDLVQMVDKDKFDRGMFRQLAFSTRDSMVRELKSRSMAAFSKGYSSLNQNVLQQVHASIKSRSKISSRVDFYIDRLLQDTMKAVDRQNIADLSKSDKIHRVKAIFDSLRYRNRFIEDVEVCKAQNLGLLEAAKDLGFAKWRLNAPENACDSCKRLSKRLFDLVNIDIDEVPPLHANSRSEIEILNEEPKDV